MTEDPSRNIVYAQRRSLPRFSAFGGTLDAQRVDEHEHPEVQLVVMRGLDSVEAGWLGSTGRRGRGRLRAGEVAIIASGQPHTFAWRAPVAISCVYIDPRHLDEIDAPEGGRVTSCFGVSDPLLRELVVELGREAASGLPRGRLYAEALEQALLVGAVRRDRSAAGPDQPRATLAPRRLAQVLDYIEHHFMQDIGLDHLATAAGMSRFHFARAFKAAIGVSPCRFVRDRRILEAKRLLDTNLPMAVIAATLGFADQSHFAARFRATVGVAPQTFRKAGRIDRPQ